MVLVSILGDFHSSIIPIFFEFKDKLTTHIILHDDSRYDTEHTQKLLKAEEKFLEKYEDKNLQRLSFTIKDLAVKEDSYEDILKTFETIKSFVNTPQELYLNATDGLSSVGIILSHKTLELGGNVIAYDRYANTYNLHTKEFMTKHKVTKVIDIKNHLKLKGYELISYTNRFTLEMRKPYIKELTKNLEHFKYFVSRYPILMSSSKEVKVGKQMIDYNDNFYLNIVKKIENISLSFLQGGVFEEYIYWLIKDNFEFDDVMTAVTIELEHNVRNEIDILIMKDNHLHSIECKFTDSFKTKEYLYKTDSIIDAIDDDGKGMILTIGKKVIAYQDLARAKKDNINFYSVKKFDEKVFLDEVKKWFLAK